MQVVTFNSITSQQPNGFSSGKPQTKENNNNTRLKIMWCQKADQYCI